MTGIYPPESKGVLLLLTAKEGLAEKVLPRFEKILGPAVFRSAWHPFEQTRYYEKELGSGLKRCLIGFQKIFRPENLPRLKKLSREIERELGDGLSPPGLAMTPGRTINIDPGYVDLFKFVLASGKAGGQKVALTKDVYAYTLLRFEKGKWIPFEWTYPDFKKEETYHPTLLEIRQSLLQDLRS